jgi:nicotinamidase-related amidase
VTSRRFSDRHRAPTDLVATNSCLIRARALRDAALDDANRRRTRDTAVLAGGVEDLCLKAIR